MAEAPRACILGCQGRVLGEGERAFFATADPLGFILFQRNCGDPSQVRRLVGALREAIGRADAPVLIDQEGGRVARLRPPHWREAPSAARFAAIGASDPVRAVKAARLNARLIATELLDLSITVNCAPVLDLPQTGADAIIGDRAAGQTPAQAADLGRAACEGYLAGGVLPVIKHIPGHGRARVDSHRALPHVAASLKELEAWDFRPFRALADMPWAMTAHLVLGAVDAQNPVTCSARVIGDIIRGWMGFDGVLVSDDLSMGALAGGMGERGRAAIDAGCDLALHCNGKMAEMEALTGAVPRLSAQSLERLARAAECVGRPMALEAEAAGRLEVLLGGARAA